MIRFFSLFGFVIISISSLFSQREMIITEMNSDDDAVLELAGEDPTAADFMLMNLGFNRSNHGWLRMRTDHDLSFYTNNLKRMTVGHDGDIGIGTSVPLTKLFVKNGNIGIETKTLGAVGQDERGSLNFYTGSNSEASLSYCDCSADGGKLVNFSIIDEGDFLFKSDDVVRMHLDKTGDLSVDALKGDGQRPLFVESDGTLTTEGSVKFQVISPTHFPNESTGGGLNYGLKSLVPSYPLLGGGVHAKSNPSIPFTKYEVLEIKVWYIDDSDEDIVFHFVGPGGPLSDDRKSFITSGASSSERSFTLLLDTTIDQEQGEDFDFSIFFRGGTLRFIKAIIKYKPLY